MAAASTALSRCRSRLWSVSGKAAAVTQQLPKAGNQGGLDEAAVRQQPRQVRFSTAL